MPESIVEAKVSRSVSRRESYRNADNFLTTQFLLCACTLKEYIEREFSIKGFLHSKKVTARVNVISQLQNKCWVRGSHCGIPIALEDFLSSFDNILQEDVFGLPHLTGRRTKTKVMRLPNVFCKCICVRPILHRAVIRACVGLSENENKNASRKTCRPLCEW